MSHIGLVLLGLGVAMDAFAVSLAKSTCLDEQETYKKWVLPFLFGCFQYVMPIIGYFLGEGVVNYLHPYDKWIACLILLYIGISMVYEHSKIKEEVCYIMTWKEMLMLSVATSLDALAIGASLALVEVQIFIATLYMGVITFLLSVFAMQSSGILRKVCSQYAECVGGIVLAGIGVSFLFR